jgi:hypothetical protein
MNSQVHLPPPGQAIPSLNFSQSRVEPFRMRAWSADRELELACKRIRWVQSMVEHPEEHAHVIARLLWGHAEVDKEDRALDESGRLTQRRLQH